MFVRSYELLLWLVSKALRFPREHRFGLAAHSQGPAPNAGCRVFDGALPGGYNR